MSTLIAPRREESAHWYDCEGRPQHEVRNKDGGMRPTTLRDARKNNWLPSVTTVLKVLDKPGLNRWKMEQAVLAAVTTPRAPEEGLDSFIARVLDEDAEQESQQARDRGTEIHAAMEALFRGEQVSPDLEPWVRKPYEALCGYGEVWATEKVLVGQGYAGTADLIQRAPDMWRIWDYKTCKKLPSKPYQEHRLQLSAYAAALESAESAGTPTIIQVGNVYISTMEPGQFAILEHEGGWFTTYYDGFTNALRLWQFLNQYWPKQ